MPGKPAIKVRVAQMGARERYTMARALHQHRMLELFCTDFWNYWGPGVKRLAALCHSKILDKVAHNFHPDLPRGKVCAFNSLGIRARLAYRMAQRKSNDEINRKFIYYGQAFCRAVNSLPAMEHNVFLGYSTASLESLQHEKRLGNLAIVNQLEPGRLEHTLIAEERRRWPGWEISDVPVPEEYYQRLEEEWRTADIVIVNSKFSQSSLLAQGVQPEKIRVIPLPLPEDEVLPGKRTRQCAGGLLRVLWLSSVCLRKGIPYLFEAARLLIKEPVRFTVVGRIGITQKALETAPGNVEFLGPVPYTQVNEVFAGADVFLLPTISEGFARVQLEAMANGLPVITTPNCGEVVSHGHDGFIVPIRDPEAIAGAVQEFLKEPQLVQFMSNNARNKLKDFNMATFGNNLRNLLETALLDKS
jgi:glycosyltransferase involved in cell wall biosynthesis